MYDNFSALKNNIRLLGDALGEAIRNSEGQALFDKVEGIRRLSKSAHSSAEIDRTRLTETLVALGNDELVPVAQAFAQFLNLVNIAEQYQTVSNVQQQETDNFLELDNVYSQLKDKQLSDEEIARALAQLKIELVLTAHPTEIARRTLIHKYSEIAASLRRLEHESGSSLSELEALHTRLEELVVQAWHTQQIREQRPSPIDEAKWGFAVVENSLWDALPRYLRQLDRVQQTYLGRSLPLTASPIRFVSWMGGDRDGNPNVTAQITHEVLLLSRWKAVDLYLRDIDVLISELSITDCNDEIRQLAGDASEPYRAVLRSLKHRLLSTRDYLSARLAGRGADESNSIQSLEELWQPLYACYRSLHETGIGIVADGLLLDCLRRVRCFGLYLVRLDIRQESGLHLQVLSELTRYLELGDYAEWDEARKQDFLLRELDSKRPLIPKHWTPSPMVREVLDTFAIIAGQPRQALGAYVISMARAPSDVLAVKLLLKEADCPFAMPVAPLFETLDDLNHCAQVLKRLLQIDWYRRETAGRQLVMIGYSDSAKDAGAMAAQWAQYRAQEALIEVCESQGIDLTLFHGRGGTIGRGGSPAHAALLSQPPGSLKGGLRVTEQGEMIRVKLGLPDVAVSTFNIYTSAILEAHLQPPPEPKANWRAIMDKLAEESCSLYRKTVYDTPEFIDYFRLATPESELAKLPLGSRPAKRRPEGGVESLRAIPWIFAWTQNRLMLPAWLGAGAALRSAIEAGHKAELEEMCRDWPFFSTRLGMLEMVYSKADLSLSEYYEQRLVPQELWPLGRELRAQLGEDIKAVLAIANDAHLMEDHPWIQKAVQLRNIYTDPLNLLQAELLFRYRRETDSRVEQALMVTIAGIAAGMRNTG